jgi:DNA polymerase
MYSAKNKTKIKKMNQITSEASSCLKCALGEYRTNVVLGSGNLDAEIAFIGEAPGRKEDESGLPFVGSAGILLDNLLNSVGINRNDVFIGNILKCRPPGNRRPKRSEVAACENYLIRQLEIIEPEVIVPMGNSALNYFQDLFELDKLVIGEAHGKLYICDSSWSKVSLIPLYHPAAAIYRRHLLEVLIEDMKKLTLF